MGRKRPLPVLRGVTITDIGSEGNAIARVDDVVLFVPGMIPGDVVDVRVTRKRKRHMEGVAVAVITPSPDRITPPCRHFGVCGGCRWQHLPYDRQLYYKARQVRDNLERIGHLTIPMSDPISGSSKIYGYRNKLEFTFSERRWLTEGEAPLPMNGEEGSVGKPFPGESHDVAEERPRHTPALGFHIPGVFDKVLDIRECLLMEEPSDTIRNEVRQYALTHRLPFYDFREQKGFLRNLVIRISSTGEVMVILVTTDARPDDRDRLLSFIGGRFPEVSSLYSIINTKRNDNIADLQPVHIAGNPYITEVIEGLRFRIGPKSFFQTNSGQAARLYAIVKEFAQLTGRENLYDLYCGTGTIACCLASGAGQVTGLEYIDEAVADARINVADNHIGNAHFLAGDIRRVLNDDLFALRGRPDVIVTDPPRAGMHPDVVSAINASGADRVVYVSCNPATQARDMALLSEKYELLRTAPVDMFPHTFHVENVALLKRR